MHTKPTKKDPPEKTNTHQLALSITLNPLLSLRNNQILKTRDLRIEDEPLSHAATVSDALHRDAVDDGGRAGMMVEGDFLGRLEEVLGCDAVVDYTVAV